MKKKQAISLIVLVITIIVMIILAGAIILSLNNSGIINQASNAVDKSNEAQIKNIVQVYWGEAYAESETRTKEDLDTRVRNKIKASNIDVSEYGILVTTSGVKVVKGWVQDGLVVRKGTQEIEIGSKIAYNEIAGETIQNLTDVSWRILGASDSGELLIMTINDISTYTVGNSSDLNAAYRQFLNIADELDNICKSYGNGKDATGARSIRVEDVDKITGYNKNTYQTGKVDEYGNEVTYSYNNGTTKPAYTSTNGSSGVLGAEHTNGFFYGNGTNFISVDLNKSSGNIVTLKSTCYAYDASDVMDSTRPAYEMLFKTNQDLLGYVLASSYVHLNTQGITYGCLAVIGDKISASDIYIEFTGGWGSQFILNSKGTPQFISGGVRAVVSLSPSVNLIATEDGVWKY